MLYLAHNVNCVAPNINVSLLLIPSSIQTIRLKLLKYIVRAPAVGPIISALVKTMFDHRVIIFTCMLALVIFAFTLGFTIAIGQVFQEYRSIGQLENILVKIIF
jgi:hypothetical protein